MPDPVQALFHLSLAPLCLHLDFFSPLSGWVPGHSRNSPDSRGLFLGVGPLCPSKRTGRQEVEVSTYVVRGLGLEHTECIFSTSNQKKQGAEVEKQEVRGLVGRCKHLGVRCLLCAMRLWDGSGL